MAASLMIRRTIRFSRPSKRRSMLEVSALRSPSAASVFPPTIHAYTASRSAPATIEDIARFGSTSDLRAAPEPSPLYPQ
jgi:hypothetical protein